MIQFVVLCGGNGSRLWPKSREKLPKQFLKITNDNTMLQNTLLRIINVMKKIENNNMTAKITVICNKEHMHIVDTQIQELAINIETIIICEPKGRDSAPAICVAALCNNVNDFTFILPCDHIFNDDAFALACQKSLSHLNTSIVTFGIKPTHIETGYGYIQTTSTNNNTIKFIEKPKYELAKQFFEEGTYFWNVGIFAFQNKNMISCFKKYATDIFNHCLETVTTIRNININTNTIILPDSFINCRAISIDYAIMEPLCKDSDLFVDKITIVMGVDAGWNDIGSFSALYEEMKKDENNNIIKGDVMTFDTKDCYIESNSSLIATVDIQNIIIVETDDALLVCNKDSTQNVKKIIESLKINKRDEAYFHKTVYRPWGYYKNIEGNDTSGFKVKRISVYPNKRLSLQSHSHRSEHWVIVKGIGKVILGTEEIILYKNDHIYIPIKVLHRIENIGVDLLEFTETQVGEYLGEDDIIRYNDDFGRL